MLDLIERNYVDNVDSEKLAISAIEGMLKTLDPYSAYLTPERYKELLSLMQESLLAEPSSSPFRDARIFSFLNLVLVQKKSAWSVHRIPWFTKIAWLWDNDHLLLKERNALSVLELSTSKRATIKLLPDVHSKTVLFHNTLDRRL